MSNRNVVNSAFLAALLSTPAEIVNIAASLPYSLSLFLWCQHISQTKPVSSATPVCVIIITLNNSLYLLLQHYNKLWRCRDIRHFFISLQLFSICRHFVFRGHWKSWAVLQGRISKTENFCKLKLCIVQHPNQIQTFQRGWRGNRLWWELVGSQLFFLPLLIWPGDKNL